MYQLTYTAPNATPDTPTTYTLDPDAPHFRELIEDMPPMHRRVLQSLVGEVHLAISQNARTVVSNPVSKAAFKGRFPGFPDGDGHVSA